MQRHAIWFHKPGLGGTHSFFVTELTAEQAAELAALGDAVAVMTLEEALRFFAIEWRQHALTEEDLGDFFGASARGTKGGEANEGITFEVLMTKARDHVARLAAGGR